MKDYVILGPADEWEKDDTKLPVALKLSTGKRKKIEKKDWIQHTVAYMAWDLDLSIKANPIPGIPANPPSNYKLKIPAQLEYSDKSIEKVIVEVENHDGQ